MPMDEPGAWPADRPGSGRRQRMTVTVHDVLTAASDATYGGLHPSLVGDPTGEGLRTRWIGADELLAEPAHLLDLVRAAGRRRFGSDDTSLVLAQVAREVIASMATAAVGLWAHQRRLLDLSAANVALAEGDHRVVVGLRRPSLAVLADDALAHGGDDVVVVDEVTMFERLLAGVLGRPLAAGDLPGGPAHGVPALAAVIAATRAVSGCGERHLWGTAALGASNALTTVSHALGKSADRDRERLLAARPDLARTLTLTTVDARGEPIAAPLLHDDTITFAARKTCCLLTKLPAGQMCGTCSLRDEADCRRTLTDWYVGERRRARGRG
jgi:hypothetical protein